MMHTWLSITSRTLFTCLCVSACAAKADVRLPAIFGDHMVLQRDQVVPVWGWADPGERVTVSAGGDGAVATAGADGRWSVKLTRLTASSKPIEMSVAGKNTITYTDVLVGDVWVCSGQSNMEFGIKAFMTKEEFAEAGEPQIRLFSVPKKVAPAPMSDIAPAPDNMPLLGTWQVCTPEMLVKTGEWSGFPGVAYYFGREIHGYTGQPVGLIGSCWGGTRINSWMSIETLQSDPMTSGYARGAVEFRDNYEQIKNKWETETQPEWEKTLARWKVENKDALAAFDAAQKDWGRLAREASARGEAAPPRPVAPRQPREPRDPVHNNQNSAALYNGMIAPLMPYGIKGVVWYQGESNGDQPVFYHTALPAMIKGWRSEWGQGDFPFLVVQLPNFMAPKPEPSKSTWAGVREAQASVAASLPNTGVAVTIDIGDARNIHPPDKYDVGHRLALLAQQIAYGNQNIVPAGPVYKQFRIEGAKIRVGFANLGGGLTIGAPPEHFYASQRNPVPKPDQSKLEGFAIAGADHKFVWADAVIDRNTVVVSSPSVPSPVAVRYAWADNPICNLYNQEGLPAMPFRTDDLSLGNK